MEDQDLEPQKQKPKPRDLEPLSIEALNEYIAEMEAEIDRVRRAIAAKQGHRVGAEGLFKR